MSELTDPKKSKGGRVNPMDQSGILSLRTIFLSRTQAFRRPKKLFRPPLWFNLSLLVFAVVLGAAASLHRRLLDKRFAALVKENAAAPFELKRIRQELAGMETDEKTMSRELDARLKYLDSLKRNEFYITIRTKERRFSFHYGDRVVRDAPVKVGPGWTIETKKGDRWTFAPLTGAFNVRQKLLGASWKAPQWVYAMNHKEPPRPLPTIPNGLGSYVLVLSEDYVIHSPPAPESPLKGPKPGSFMVPEADLAAIWRRLGPQTRVYIF